VRVCTRVCMCVPCTCACVRLRECVCPLLEHMPTCVCTHFTPLQAAPRRARRVRRARASWTASCSRLRSGSARCACGLLACPHPLLASASLPAAWQLLRTSKVHVHGRTADAAACGGCGQCLVAVGPTLAKELSCVGGSHHGGPAAAGHQLPQLLRGWLLPKGRRELQR